MTIWPLSLAIDISRMLRSSPLISSAETAPCLRRHFPAYHMANALLLGPTGMRSNSTSLDLNDPSLPGANATGATPTQVEPIYGKSQSEGPIALYVHCEMCRLQPYTTYTYF